MEPGPKSPNNWWLISHLPELSNLTRSFHTTISGKMIIGSTPPYTSLTIDPSSSPISLLDHITIPPFTYTTSLPSPEPSATTWPISTSFSTSLPSSHLTITSTLSSTTHSLINSSASPTPQAVIPTNAEIGLAIGLLLAGIITAFLAAFTTYYCVRARKVTSQEKRIITSRTRWRSMFSSSGWIKPELDGEGWRKELPNNEQPIPELDGEHWRRELPASPVDRTVHGNVVEIG